MQAGAVAAAAGGAAPGRDGAEAKSSAILQFLQFYSEGGKHDPLFISNYATINVLDRLTRMPGVGAGARCSARSTTRCASGSTPNRLVSLNLTPSRHHHGDPGAERAGAGRPHRRAADHATTTQFQLNLQTQGRLTTPEQFGNIVIRANPDGSVLRVRDVARVELGAATHGHAKAG